MLVIGERHALAGGFGELLGDGFVTNGEGEYLRGNAGLGGHSYFAFPGFADPTFMGYFLEQPGALAAGVTVTECDPDPGGETDGGDDEKRQCGVDDPACSRCHDFAIVPQIGRSKIKLVVGTVFFEVRF